MKIENWSVVARKQGIGLNRRPMAGCGFGSKNSLKELKITFIDERKGRNSFFNSMVLSCKQIENLIYKVDF